MALDQRKYGRKHTDVLRDMRPLYERMSESITKPNNAFVIFAAGAALFYFVPSAILFGDVIFVLYLTFFWWLTKRSRAIAFKMPMGGKWKDENNVGPGRSGKPEGILYLGNTKDTKEEVWFTNSDARTHILYLGTTGSGKTEGLKSMVSNAMAWGAGFIYVDGKADTDLWSSLSSLVRRLGRDDDLLVLNYMTGNSDTKAPSNTMNPFSSGSASYLTNMLVSLMPESGGDNAMWKERAVSLVGSIMPALTWKRDNQDIPMSVSTIREYLTLNNVIKLSRDKLLPEDVRIGLRSYLDTLPGYIDDAYDDDGHPKPPGPDTPQYDTTTASQQHGYLSMQFTRSLQSLGDEYGYIFDTQAADVVMADVVLNRRILIVLIPALEKSSDETANLGKIVAATLKGMMGSTLGATVEGESASVIENKPTHSSTPFMTVFDEVGYYTAEGMAVMAAQARSLGFSLIYAAQDLPALEKRVKEEARSITANCNLKIFGKLEDPTQTKEFFEKTVGSALVMEASSFQLEGGSKGNYYDTKQAGVQERPRANYDGLRGMTEGQAVFAFGETVIDVNVFYSNPGHAKAMRVTRFISLPPPDEAMIKHADAVTRVRDLMVHKTWTAIKADVAADTPGEIEIIAKVFETGTKKNADPVETGMAALASVYALHAPDDFAADAAKEDSQSQGTQSGGQQGSGGGGSKAPAAAAPAKPAAAQTPPAAPPPAKDSAPPQEEKAPANPMGFFGAKKSGDSAAAPAQDKPESPPSEPARAASEEENKGISWEQLMSKAKQADEKAENAQSTAPTQESQSAQNEPAQTADAAENKSAYPAPPPLDGAAASVIEQAGRSAHESIFRNKKSKDSETQQ